MRNNFFIYDSGTYFFIKVLTVLVLLLPVSQSFAAPILKIDPDKQFDFAEYTFSTGDYFRAIGEYKRFIYFFPEDEKIELAMHRIGMSYFNSGLFREAIDSFNSLINKYGVTYLSIKSYWMISECHMKLNAPGPAIVILQNLTLITDDSDVKDEAYYRIGWIYLETASWEKARLFFGKVSEKNRNKYILKRLSAELDREKSIKKKNPVAAGFLSILPGAGYLYCERYKDALISFLVNGGLIFAAYESFDNDNYALGGVISVVEMGFYTGNIYGSITSAHKYNRTKTRDFIENLKKNMKIDLSSGYNNNGIAVSFRYDF